jgi:hypothetical protein
MKLKITLALVLISSILLNVYFLTHKPEPVIRTITEIREVERPVTVTKIITKYETKLITESVLISSNASVEEKAQGYDLILNSEMIINTNPLTIVEDTYGKVYVPEKLTGDARIAFLKYDVNIYLNPVMEWKRSRIPIDVGYGLMNLKPEIGVCVDIPFTDYDLMLGMTGINVGYTMDLLKNTKLRFGIGMDYSQRIITFLGLRTQI